MTAGQDAGGSDGAGAGHGASDGDGSSEVESGGAGSAGGLEALKAACRDAVSTISQQRRAAGDLEARLQRETEVRGVASFVWLRCCPWLRCYARFWVVLSPVCTPHCTSPSHRCSLLHDHFTVTIILLSCSVVLLLLITPLRRTFLLTLRLARRMSHSSPRP